MFIDWRQNADYTTTVGVYSLRATQQRPFASMPVTWDELARARKRANTETLYFDPKTALARLENLGDLFSPVNNVKQTLPADLAQVLAEQTSAKGALGELCAHTMRNAIFSVTAEPFPSAPRRSTQGSRRRFVVRKHAASHLHFDFRLEMHDVLKSWAVPKGIPYELGMRRLASATEDHPLDYLDFEGVIFKGQHGGGTVMIWEVGSGSAAKPIPAKKEDQSRLTGRTMAQIAEARDATWHSNRTSVPGLDLDELPRSEMQFVEPMLAKPVCPLDRSSRL